LFFFTPNHYQDLLRIDIAQLHVLAQLLFETRNLLLCDLLVLRRHHGIEPLPNIEIPHILGLLLVGTIPERSFWLK